MIFRLKIHPTKRINFGSNWVKMTNLVETDPTVVNEIQTLDFSSSFEESQQNNDSYVFSDDEDILLAAEIHGKSPTKVDNQLRPSLKGSILGTSVTVDSKSYSPLIKAPVSSSFKSIATLLNSPTKVFTSPRKRLATSPVKNDFETKIPRSFITPLLSLLQRKVSERSSDTYINDDDYDVFKSFIDEELIRESQSSQSKDVLNIGETNLPNIPRDEPIHEITRDEFIDSQASQSSGGFSSDSYYDASDVLTVLNDAPGVSSSKYKTNLRDTQENNDILHNIGDSQFDDFSIGSDSDTTNAQNVDRNKALSPCKAFNAVKTIHTDSYKQLHSPHKRDSPERIKAQSTQSDTEYYREGVSLFDARRSSLNKGNYNRIDEFDINCLPEDNDIGEKVDDFLFSSDEESANMKGEDLSHPISPVKIIHTATYKHLYSPKKLNKPERTDVCNIENTSRESYDTDRSVSTLDSLHATPQENVFNPLNDIKFDTFHAESNSQTFKIPISKGPRLKMSNTTDESDISYVPSDHSLPSAKYEGYIDKYSSPRSSTGRERRLPSLRNPDAVLNDPEVGKNISIRLNFQENANVNITIPFHTPQLLQTRAYSTKANNNRTIQLNTQKPDLDDTPSTVKRVKPIILSQEQEYVLKQVTSGVSLFYTGSAGTGKSILLKSIIKALRQKYPRKVAVTASTGLAACNIGGITLHSFAGVGLANHPTETLVKKVQRNKRVYRRWLDTKVLIIDEISMVSGELLNKFNEMAKIVRKNDLPFGGIQVVACGDFYQLPPIADRLNPDGSEKTNAPSAVFAFECEAWDEIIEKTIMLKEIFRQKGDQTFINMLNEVRYGKVSAETVKEFKALDRPIKCPAGIQPAELFATRSEVDRANNTRLNNLAGKAQVYKALDGGTLPPDVIPMILLNVMAPQRLFLKKDAQVMCIKNFDETLVNGSLGTVIDFMDRQTYMKAYGSQPEDSDLPGESDYIFNSMSDKDDQELPEALKKLQKDNRERKEVLSEDIEECTKDRKYPLVKFMLPDGVNTRVVLMEPELWLIENEKQKILASRMQLPLILAWSLSIHKSQGQTLPRVKVDLRKVFENGQAYVALSRAISRMGLQVCNFDRMKVSTNPKVISFYENLSIIEPKQIPITKVKRQMTHPF